MFTRILVVSCIWFSALCVCDSVYQSGGLQQCRDYPRVDITISVSVYYCITITVSKGGYYNHSNWHHDDSALSRGPQTLGFCKASGTIARSITLQISPSCVVYREKTLLTMKHPLCNVQADNEDNKNDLLDIQLVVLLHPDQPSNHLVQRTQHFDPRRGQTLPQWGRALEGEWRSHLCQPSTGDFRLWLG